MSRRIRGFLALRQDKNGTTQHAATVAYEHERPKSDPNRKAPELKFDTGRTLAAITRGQRIPMTNAKAEKLLRRLAPR